MADAMDRVRAAEERYNAVIERTTELNENVESIARNLRGFNREAERTVEVLNKLQRELEREEQAAKSRHEKIEQANRVPLPVHRWFWPVALTAFFFGLFGSFLRAWGEWLVDVIYG